MIKNFQLFESIDDVITSYIIGIPSGEVIDLNEDDIVNLKKERLIIYDSKYRMFVYLDENRRNISNFLNKNIDGIEKVKSFLSHIKIKEDDYRIYDNLSVDVFCDVDMSQRGLTEIPIKFNLIAGNFDCSMNKLKNVINSPDTIFGYFDCSFNDIYSLIGGPTSVRDGYYCSDNLLENLYGFPTKCGIVFDCSSNNIKTMKGCPEIINFADFDISRNKLKDLRDGPKEVKNFDCSHNEITTLSGGIINSDKFVCTHNKLISLLGMPTNNTIIYLAGNEIDDIEYD